MAKVSVQTKAVKPADAWDEIGTVHLKLSREQAKVVYTLVGKVAIGYSGNAGKRAEEVYNAFPDNMKLYTDNNLYIEGSNLIIKSK